MSLFKNLRHIGIFSGLESDLKKLKIKYVKKPRAKVLIETYMNNHQIKKLQLGSGPTRLTGWLETDIKAKPDCAYLNATEKFPFDDNSFDYIFSEHMIEHLSWNEGNFMLKECRRILKPGGIIRIATPDLEVFLNLYFQKNDLGTRYINWITDRDLKGVNECKPSFVINNIFRNYGHKFIYDGELLKLAFKNAGFKNPTRVNLGVSNDSNLCNLESHGKDIGSEQLASFETMVFESY